MAEPAPNDPLTREICEGLESSGAMSSLKAQLRAEVAAALMEKHGERPPSLTSENLLINELFREYLLYNGYRHTEATLMTESGQPRERLTREILTAELHIRDTADTRDVPLLYSIVTMLRENRTK